ncbi:MAG: XTP/dITP diphosphatase [Oscillospiraceae bacterium]|nr:XTP/dITP diphosphatase [Oscillospiraceae bacterium]MBR6695774.1 XTP/dITP diphosphatase [Oscillospiraceae bacterium]
MKIILASNNKNKIVELKQILFPLGYEIISQSEAGVNIEVEESGTTFEENSMIKAKAIYEISKMPVIADDSGLEVDYLGKAPGVYSHRYAGENATDKDRCKKILNELDGVSDEKRTARFVCVISYIDSNGNASVMRGECEGFIGKEMKGDNGFGYDPIFMIGDRSFAEISSEEKNTISHRANALKKLTEKLKGEKYDNNKAES